MLHSQNLTTSVLTEHQSRQGTRKRRQPMPAAFPEVPGAGSASHQATAGPADFHIVRGPDPFSLAANPGYAPCPRVSFIEPPVTVKDIERLVEKVQKNKYREACLAGLDPKAPDQLLDKWHATAKERAKLWAYVRSSATQHNTCLDQYGEVAAKEATYGTLLSGVLDNWFLQQMGKSRTPHPTGPR